MSLVQRFRVWRRKRRRKRAAKKQDSPLREFVYLDDVSVYSLIASKLGAIATEFTDSETSSLGSEMSSTVGADAGFLKSSMGSKIQSSETRGSQVLRKSIVQTTFKELYELEKTNLKPRPPSEPSPSLAEGTTLSKALEKLGEPWIIAGDTLTRGDLVELEVELEAEPIYKNSTVISTMVQLMEENSLLANAVKASDLRDVEAVAQVLERLLSGLVPIRAKATSYSVLQVDGEDLLIHRDVCRSLPESDRARLRPLNLVGVAEESLFWKDIRRVLFSNSDFRVFSRVSRSGIRQSWTPVKLAHVLQGVMPDFGQHLESFNRSLVDHTGDTETRQLSSGRGALACAVESYATMAAAAADRELPEDFDYLATLDGPADAVALGSVEERRRIFGSVTAYLEREFDIRIATVAAAQLRTAAMLDAGFEPDGSLTQADQAVVPSAPTQDQAQVFLDVEFVAIYW